MPTIPNFSYDANLIDDISSRFNLRDPNREAFAAAIEALGGDVNPDIPLVLSLATGVGKTYIMAAIIEYLREIGLLDVIIVTPGKIVQAKTVANFQIGSKKFIEGGRVPAKVITPENYDAFRPQADDYTLIGQQLDPVQLFVLNVQQLTSNATQLPSERELSGNLNEYLRGKKNLIVLADEHHLYSLTAKAFREGIMALGPAAVIGLTASAADTDDVRYRYTLRQAISDRYVKRPVIAFRKGGYGKHEEEQQLRDALALLAVKQQAYETYRAANPGAPAINPVLFVQCADIDHATATVQLLRTPEFFGSQETVLQVDNQHDDANTVASLENIDSPRSRVRAVVSVNKLKEGWDVKNVAVMVTLRAMASEVLTQQTLGRGLRLPFGYITGVSHVDQLDIIAHESFTSMLSNEKILKEFGLDAIRTEPRSKSEVHTPAGHTGRLPPATTDTTAISPTGTNDTPIALPTDDSNTRGHVIDGGVGVIELGANDVITTPPPPQITTISINDEFADLTFTFPSTEIRFNERPLRLVDQITGDTIDAAARGITDASAVLHRHELSFKTKKLRTIESEDVAVGSIHIGVDDAKAELVRQALHSRSFDSSSENIRYVTEMLVPRLMHAASLAEWTDKTVRAAIEAIRDVISTAALEHRRSLGEETIITPRVLPIAFSYPLRPGETTLDLLSTDATAKDFSRGRHYAPWHRGLFPAAKFDSFSAEYQLASMLDRSTQIEWWKRLYPSDRASIAYSTTSSYNPDFVARDLDGIHWIIEGKSEDGRDDDKVEAKRRAAANVVERLPLDPTFDDQQWGYAIAFESDVKRADSWNDLIRSINTVQTQRY